MNRRRNGNSDDLTRRVALVHGEADHSVEGDRMALTAARVLADAGRHVTVVVPKGRAFERAARDERLAVVPLSCAPPDSTLPWESITRIGGACGVFWGNRIQLVHCTTPLPVPSVLPAARMLKIPVVAGIHAVTSDARIDRSLCRFTDLLMPSTKIAKEWITRYLRGKKTSTVRRVAFVPPSLPMPSDGVAGRAEVLRKKFAATRDDVVVAMAGEPNPGAGCDLLLEATAVIAQRGLHPPVWISCGPSRRAAEYCESLAVLAEELGVGAQVHFPGADVDRETLFAAADIVAVPSRIDPIGLTAGEAMLGGAAVIVSGTGGLPERVEHGVTGLVVPPIDPTALGDGIFRLLVDLDLRSSLSESGKEFALRYYRNDSFCNKLLEAHRFVSGGTSDRSGAPPGEIIPPSAPTPSRSDRSRDGEYTAPLS